MIKFSVPERSTVRMKLLNVPVTFEVYDSNGNVYYFRHLSEKQNEIKFNIAHKGIYQTNVSFEKLQVTPIEIKLMDIELPPYQKNFATNYDFVRNDNLTGTPARNFYKKGIIEYGGDDFWKQPFPIRVFILCHELGHSYYHDEQLADLWGCQKFLKLGYNASSAYYALKDVLNYENPVNRKRILNLVKSIIHG